MYFFLTRVTRPLSAVFSLFFNINVQFSHDSTAFCVVVGKLQGSLNLFWKKLPYFLLMYVDTYSVGRAMASAGCLGMSNRKLFATELP